MNKIDNYSSFNYKNSSYSTTAYSLSEDFDGFIINEGTDLTFFNPSSFSHEFMTPQFGNQSYFMGTTQENREFNFSILLKAVTMAKYKNFLRWLNPKDEGILWFDYNPNWGYDVKVNSISEAKFTVNKDCTNELTYNIELTVGFITKNDWAARLVTEPEYLALPLNSTRYYYADGTTGSLATNAIFKISHNSNSPVDYIIENLSNVDNFINIGLTNCTSFTLLNTSGITTHSFAGPTTSFIFYSEYGIAIDTSTNHFFIGFLISEGPIIFEPYQPKTIRITATASVVSIKPIIREII